MFDPRDEFWDGLSRDTQSYTRAGAVAGLSGEQLEGMRRENGFASSAFSQDTGQPAPAGSCLCPRVLPNEVSSSAGAPRCFQDRSRPGLNGTAEGGGDSPSHPPVSLLHAIWEGSGYTKLTRKRGKTEDGAQKISSLTRGKAGEGVINPVPMIPQEGAARGCFRRWSLRPVQEFVMESLQKPLGLLCWGTRKATQTPLTFLNKH